MQLWDGVSGPARRILFGNVLAAIGSGMTLSFLVIYLGNVRGLGTTIAGLLVAYMAILTLICSTFIGALVDRVGPRPVLMAGQVWLAISILLLAFVRSLPAAVVVVTLCAIGNSAIWPPQAALYARVSAPEHRQRVFGIQFMMLNLGLGIGGLIAAVIIDVANPASFELTYYVDSATTFAYFLVIAGMRGVGVGAGIREASDRSGPDGYRRVLRDRALRRLLIGAIVMLTFGYGSLEVGLPVYATSLGALPVSFVAIAYAANTGVIVVAQLFVLRLIQGRSRSRVAAVVGLMWAVSWLFVGVSVGLPAWLAALTICVGLGLFGLGETLWSPVAPAIANDLAPDHLRGRYNAVNSWSWGVSGTIGPAFAAIVLGAGLSALWICCVVVGCIGSAFVLLSMRHLLTPRQDGRDQSSIASTSERS